MNVEISPRLPFARDPAPRAAQTARARPRAGVGLGRRFQGLRVKRTNRTVTADQFEI